jgi:acyl dehydratase
MLRSAGSGATPAAAGLPVGESYRTYQGRIDPDAAIAYALATNDPNPVYVLGEAVPPLFTASLVLDAVQEAVRACSAAAPIHGTRNAVHGSHQIRFFEPVEPAMAVQWRATTYGATRTPAGVVVTQQLLVRTESGAPLVEHLWSTLHIGGTIDEDLGPRLPDHTFPPAARARPLGSVAFDVTVDQGFRYAGASGDRIGHSIDDEIARGEGFPRKLVQGMCTFAMCSGAVVAIAGGEPVRLRRLAGRFARPMFPSQPLVVDCYDGGRTDDGLEVVVFEANAGGETVIKHGWAELVP